MAEVTIRLRHNRKTGERELVIQYESESDALAHEHERDHQRLVESLLGVSVDELMARHGVERVVVQPPGSVAEEVAPEAGPTQPQAERHRT